MFICLFPFLSSETSTSCGVLLTPRSKKSAIHHPQPLRTDIHVCTHGCMYMNTHMCCRTYIGFSKLGFQALHVQSGPCSHSLTQSRLWRKKQNKNKNRCLSQPQWCLLVFQKWFSGVFFFLLKTELPDLSTISWRCVHTTFSHYEVNDDDFCWSPISSKTSSTVKWHSSTRGESFHEETNSSCNKCKALLYLISPLPNIG